MDYHPAKLMISIWAFCLAAFCSLPFRIIERNPSAWGSILFLAFIVAYAVGTLLIPPPHSSKDSAVETEFSRPPKLILHILQAASILSITGFCFDLSNKDFLDLAVAYELRSESADALLKGEASNSSLGFKISFLLYPAGFIFIVIENLTRQRVEISRLIIFGFLPIVLACACMGGRMPLLYATALHWLAHRSKHLRHPSRSERTESKYITRIAGTVFAFASILGLIYYFSAVFLVRAEVSGGAEEMFRIAEEQWGIGFNGPLASFLLGLLGAEGTYLLFVFSWYFLQGLPVGAYIISMYDGPSQFGVYGIDLISAIVRRLDPQRVAMGFDTLLSLGTYGFFPSAWGTLFIDYGFFGLFLALLWGIFSSLIYSRIRFNGGIGWRILGPFVSAGIIFSPINTPIGFTNGLVTHLWLALIFLLLHMRKQGCPTLE